MIPHTEPDIAQNIAASLAMELLDSSTNAPSFLLNLLVLALMISASLRAGRSLRSDEICPAWLSAVPKEEEQGGSVRGKALAPILALVILLWSHALPFVKKASPAPLFRASVSHRAFPGIQTRELPRSCMVTQSCHQGAFMNGVIYLVGLVVVVGFILSFLGLR